MSNTDTELASILKNLAEQTRIQYAKWERTQDYYGEKIEAALILQAAKDIQTLIQARDTAHKAALLKAVGEEEPKFSPGGATYGDTEFDHAAVIYGRNEKSEELRQSIESIYRRTHE